LSGFNGVPEKKMWQVASSKDKKNKYVVTLADKRWRCTCDGFTYRGDCRHILETKAKVKAKAKR
jgi:SWIM zinc finger